VGTARAEIHYLQTVNASASFWVAIRSFFSPNAAPAVSAESLGRQQLTPELVYPVRGRPRGFYRREKEADHSILQRLQQNGSCPERINLIPHALGVQKPPTVQFFGHGILLRHPFLLESLYLHYSRVILVRGPQTA